MTASSCARGLVLAMGVLFAPTPSLAASCDSVQFKDSVGGLVLNGLGIRKATVLKVKVYVAALYLPAKSGDAGSILNAGKPWRLELRFVYNVDASEMEDAFRDGFTKTGVSVASASVDALVGMFEDFTKGQALVFASDPAKGVAVDLDGKAKGTVEGADFAAALLAIWLGPKPPNKELKSGLLGGGCT